ncbi:MAG TPA: VOC family protein [Planctomycetota bacterium]
MRGGFADHAGYDGLILGPPAAAWEVEFTSHAAGGPCPAPTRDNLLVFYLDDGDAVAAVTTRLAELGAHPVPPENPYWEGHGPTFEDPDGWRVVVVDSSGPRMGAP